jgi:hypothetical protein
LEKMACGISAKAFGIFAKLEKLNEMAVYCS